jgi:UDP-N-acetylglucosamine--N-acetylmuramyl-(pentapeptide) pyrophosphoryl-undecaprenol N-acetylglucosamine transferase
MTPGRPLRLLLTGGGTGGHLFPAIAAAEAFCGRCPGTEVLFVGTRRKMDARSLAGHGFTSRGIHCYGLKGKNIGELCKALAVMPFSFAEAAWQIRSFAPDVVLGVGGYVTGPVVAAARILGLPTVIHEQNSVPGLANRKLGRIVRRICLSMPDSGGYFPKEKVLLTGNPVRQKILDLARLKTYDPQDRCTLLVLGGSQGAHGLNMLVAEAFTGAGREMLAGVRLIHQTGEKDEEAVKNRYLEAGLDATVSAFFQDMPAVYRQADFLVSRAGATTLSELAVLGLPSILIPYPYAADNHQEKNARYYESGGGARVFKEDLLTAEILAGAVKELSADFGRRQRRQRMGQAMLKLACPDAAGAIVDACLEAIGGRTC